MKIKPRIEGNWWPVTGMPDLGAYNSPKMQPVDFAVWQARDGSWQLWSCIRETACGGRTRLFYRWQGARLADPHWRPMGIAMEADPAFGETPGGLQAPHVIALKDRYCMFYGDWVNICLAQGEDGKTFARHLEASGRSGLFSEGPGANTRDIMVLPVGNAYLGYYTAARGGKGAVFCRSSRDLRRWGGPKVVAAGGQSGDGPSSAECPHVVQLREREVFILFRTQRYGPQMQTSVYCSKDPFDFGVNDDRYFVGHLPVAAVEIIRYEGRDYIASLMPRLNGIQIARLTWEEAK